MSGTIPIYGASGYTGKLIAGAAADLAPFLYGFVGNSCATYTTGSGLEIQESGISATIAA